MGLKNAQETEKNKVELSFTIDREVFLAAVDKAFKKNAKKITIPGFRKGKAPKGIIEKFYGKSVFYEDALNDILPEEIEKTVKETEYELADTPSVTDVDFDNEEGVLVKAEFIRKPDVKLGEYKGIKVEKKTLIVEDKDVDEELEGIRKRYSRTITIDNRPAQDKDIAVIDYEGFVDGVAFEGGKDTGHRLTLGSGAFIPGFEEQIIGKSTGEEFDVNVKFPDDYHAENLKGKEAVFKVKLNSIEAEELPELDDEFAKDASEFDTLAEYKADIKAKIEKRNADDADQRLGEDIAEALCSLVEADIPEVMIEKETDQLVREYDMNLRRQGLSLELFLKYTGMNPEDLRERHKKGAEINVKKQLALSEIAKIEKIEPTEADIEKRYEELTAQFNMKLDEIKSRISAEDIKSELTILKAFELVKDNAVITEKSVTKEELTADAAQKAEKEEKTEKKTAKKSAKQEKTAEASDETAAEAPAETPKKKTVRKAKADSEQK